MSAVHYHDAAILAYRLEQFKTQYELARNFYDDHEFCPVQAPRDSVEHCGRIQQRHSPKSSPYPSPPRSYMSPPLQERSRVIPIIDPINGTAIVPSGHATTVSPHLSVHASHRTMPSYVQERNRMVPANRTPLPPSPPLSQSGCYTPFLTEQQRTTTPAYASLRERSRGIPIINPTNGATVLLPTRTGPINTAPVLVR